MKRTIPKKFLGASRREARDTLRALATESLDITGASGDASTLAEAFPQTLIQVARWQDAWLRTNHPVFKTKGNRDDRREYFTRRAQYMAFAVEDTLFGLLSNLGTVAPLTHSGDMTVTLRGMATPRTVEVKASQLLPDPSGGDASEAAYRMKKSESSKPNIHLFTALPLAFMLGEEGAASPFISVLEPSQVRRIEEGSRTEDPRITVNYRHGAGGFSSILQAGITPVQDVLDHVEDIIRYT